MSAPAIGKTWRMHGIRARVLCPKHVEQRIRSILEYHGFRSARDETPVDWEVSVRTGGDRPDIRPPADAKSDVETGLTIHREGGALYISGSDARAVVSPDERLDLWISDALVDNAQRLPAVFYFVLTFALLALLQRRAMFAVHGAAVGLDASRGMLIIGDSDTGKSTLTMTLVRAGWSYLSDDSFFLRALESDSVVEAIPFRRDFGLDPEAERLFPELAETAEYQLTDADKLRVRIDELYPGRFLERCIPRVILFPRVDPGATSRTTAIRPTEALRHLMTQSSFVDMDAELARRQLEVLQQTIRRATCHTLVAGPDIKGNPDAADALLRPLLET